MILHPGIIALVVGSLITSLMIFYAAAVGVVIFRRWDYESSSAYQLGLERKTYLVSTLVSYGLGFQLVALVLFIYTVDDIHQLFVGAMCATGSLNANPIGWYALLSKCGVFFLSGFWLALNYVDQRAEQYPLVRLKYGLLCLILPFIGVDTVLQLSYFLGLEPDIITSCCGSLFGSGTTTAASLAGLPVLPSMIGFYGYTTLLLVLMVANLFFARRLFRLLLSFFAGCYLVVTVVAIISFVSIYIYEMPTHHCPFDILQWGYGYIGYPIYIALLGTVYFGMLPGLLQPLKKRYKLEEATAGLESLWIRWSVVTLIVFLILVTYSIVNSKLRYL